MILIVAVCVVIVTCSDHQDLITLPLRKINQQYFTELSIGHDGKKALVAVDIEKTGVRVECYQSQSKLHRAWLFLQNPFAQYFVNDCQSWPASFFVLPSIGELQTPVMLHSSADGQEGYLGLSKDSDFLRSLPERYQTFSVFINSNNYGRPSRLDLGGYDITSLKRPLIELPVSSSSPWTVELDSMELFGVKFTGGNAVMSTTHHKIGLPSEIFGQFEKFLEVKLSCKASSTNSLFCPCISGHVNNTLPVINLWFHGERFPLQPESYAELKEDKCLILFGPSKTGGWVLGLPLFRDNLLVFGHGKVHLTEALQINPISEVSTDALTQTTRSPIQTVLNCVGTILVCIFISLVLIELIRRLSGLASTQDQTIHDVMIRHRN